MARINEVIDGKYEIQSEIGRGGMSIVYLAKDKRLNKFWAVKEFRKNQQDEENRVNLESLLHEANIMKKLDHPTLPRIVDIIDDNKSVYIVMDYIEGEPLSKVLDAFGAQPQEVVIEWAKQLADVFDYLHTQDPPVIYRDMKPANIMLKPDNTIRVFDFGIAREYKEGKDGDTIPLGTRGYAAPEQFGDSQTDARTDIYSFGVTLYHLLTGKNPAEPPYEIYPIRHWNPSLSSGLEWLIQKCTQLNPNDRYQSFAEITYVLENLEKFDGAYKRKQRSRINLFITTAILTLIFSISAASFFGVAYAEQQKNYEYNISLNTIDGYEEAINIDDKKAEAYTKLIDKLREEISVIYLEAPEGRELAPNEITNKKIVEIFSDERMEELKAINPAAYVSINYELGRLYWNKYEDSSGQDAGVLQAKVYFEKVIKTAKEMEEQDGIKNGGLGDQQYNFAKAYYLVSFFQSKRSILEDSDDGKVYTDSDGIAEYAGVVGLKEDHTFENAYYSFWATDKNLLDLVNVESTEEITSKVKFETLKRLIYITQDNYFEFFRSGGVSADEMEEFFSEFANALEIIENSKAIDQEEINSLKEQVNNAIRLINAQYKLSIKKIG